MFKLLKNIFQDVGLLYRNFLHWNFSKISIGFFGFLMAFAIMIPFLLITFTLFFILNVDWYGYTVSFMNATLTNEMILYKDFFIWAILGGINIFIFFIAWNYTKLMYFDLNLKYLNGKKAKYIKSKFFHFPILIDFYKISARILGILFLPVIIFIISIILLIIGYGGINSVEKAILNGDKIFPIISIIFFIIAIISFIYLSYRMYFSYILLLDKDQMGEKRHSSKHIIRKSFKLTKGWKKPLKLTGILLLFSIIILPFTITGQALNNTYSDMRDYEIYQQLSIENKEKLQSKNPYKYGKLQVKYKDFSLESLQKNIQIYYYLIIFFNIFSFLLIGGLVEMIMVSFYKRELTHK